MSAPNEYPLMIVCPAFTYRHLRDEGTVYGFRSGNGFVDKLDVERFGWEVRTMDDPTQPEETLNREDGAPSDPRPDPQTHPEYWTE